MWSGTVVSIHIAMSAAAPMLQVAEVRALPGCGLEGDRYLAGAGFYSKEPIRGGREVTLIETETVEDLRLAAGATRRNITTSGAPLNRLVDREFRVGAVLMRGTRLCEPCKYLEDLTQPGIMRALIHRGGLRAQILSEGIIHVGDTIRPIA